MDIDMFRRMTRGMVTDPASASLWEVPAEDSQTFQGCPYLPRMVRALNKLKAAAIKKYDNRSDAQTIDDQLPPMFTERSWITSARPVPLINISMSYEAEAGWYMSASQTVGGKREPATRVEMTGWVMAGWPQARQMITWQMSTGAALHVVVPTQYIDNDTNPFRIG